MTPRATAPADVCLLLEGTWPYVAGGVSSWVHDLMRSHPSLTFDVVSLVPDAAPRARRYEAPPNLRAQVDVPLQVPPLGLSRPGRRWPGQRDGAAVAAGLEVLARLLLGRGRPADLETFAAAARSGLGRRLLLDGPAAFAVLQHAYAEVTPDASFLDFFWSWRSLGASVLSVLLAPVPPARCYHAVSTGFAGLLGARLAGETGRPLILSEHGVYTNERRIEVAMAEWLHRGPDGSLAPEKTTRDLRDVWVGAFEGFSRLTYAAADPIITLYRGNQAMQRRDGALPERSRIIPNGIDADRYGAIPREALDAAGAPRRPTVALIGRVVPIKDIKTYIRAAAILRLSVPEVAVEILGPEEEDPAYAAECRALVAELGLGATVSFRGRVDVAAWLGRIDVQVLTSISEAQPLTILEAGAAGVPSVATDVGSCREMIEGDPAVEVPPLGPGGAVTPVADPAATAAALAALLLDPGLRARAARSMQARIRARYLKTACDAAYAAIYREAGAGAGAATIPIGRVRIGVRGLAAEPVRTALAAE